MMLRTLMPRLTVCLALSLLPALSYAVCSPLLKVEGAREGQGFMLNGCEVDLDTERTVDSAPVVFKLRGIAAIAWRDTFAGHTPANDQLGRLGFWMGGLPDNSLPIGRLGDTVSRFPDGKSPPWQWNSLDNSLTAAAVPGTEAVAPNDAQCAGLSGASMRLWSGDREVAPSEVLAPNVYLNSGEGALKQVPAACITTWSVSDTALVALPNAHRGVMQVAWSVPPGRTATVRAEVAGTTVTGRIRVVDPRKVLAPGIWHEVSSVSCDGAARFATAGARELRVASNRKFSYRRNADDTTGAIAGTVRAMPEAGWFELRMPVADGHGTKQAFARLNTAAQLEVVDWDMDPFSEGPANAKLCRLIFERRTDK